MKANLRRSMIVAIIALTVCACHDTKSTPRSRAITGNGLQATQTKPIGAGANRIIGKGTIDAKGVDWAAKLPYAPTFVGDTWIHQTGEQGEETFSAETVVNVTEQDNATVVTVAVITRSGVKDIRNELTVTEKGIFDSKINVFDHSIRSDRYCMLQLPVEVGAKWEVRVRGIKNFMSDRVGSAQVSGEEDVEVPAGQFRAVKVLLEYSDDGKPVRRTTNWYARGVGLVRWEYDNGTVWVLKEFTRGNVSDTAK